MCNDGQCESGALIQHRRKNTRTGPIRLVFYDKPKNFLTLTSCEIRQLVDNFANKFIMSDFFKSALGYISGGGVSKDENDFVGQQVELGNQKLRVKRVIAKGNYLPHPHWQQALIAKNNPPPPPLRTGQVHV